MIFLLKVCNLSLRVVLLQTFYTWFIQTPFGSPSLSTLQVCALYLTVRVATYTIPQELPKRLPRNEVIGRQVATAILWFVAWLAGFVIHFITP